MSVLQMAPVYTGFLSLAQISVGKDKNHSFLISPEDIQPLFDEAEKHGLTGIIGETVTQFIAATDDLGEYEDAYYQWMGEVLAIEEDNRHQISQIVSASLDFEKNGIRTCLLKGQGVVQLYPNPDHRLCGDIDLWVEGPKEKVLKFIAERGWKIDRIVVHHAEVSIFNDVPVEIHFIPSYSYSPFRNIKYHKYFRKEADSQFNNYNTKMGFNCPTNSFNAVYLLLHIFRHVFYEGIGLRQLMDYYFLLIKLFEEERQEAMKTLKWMGLSTFTASVMYVEKEVFGLSSEYFLCEPNERKGTFLLQEILRSGNLGRSDDRLSELSNKKGFQIFFMKMKRLVSIISLSPSEVLWAPIWKVWHWGWRKWKGYM